MASDKQIAANRQNAQKSTGPKTPAGKQRSARNATRLGLFASNWGLVLEPDELKELDSYVRLHIASMSPKGLEEWYLAERIARLNFSLERCRDLELVALTDPDGELITRLIRSTNPLLTLSTYEGRIARERERARRQLKELQDLRHPKEAESRSNAEKVAFACTVLNEPFDAQAFGFDFSHTDITRKYGERMIVELAEAINYTPSRTPGAIEEFRRKADLLKQLAKQGA